MNKADRDKLLLRIGEARFKIKIKENITPMDSKIDELLGDCADVLWKHIPLEAHWVFGTAMGHEWMKCSNCCKSQFPNGCWRYCPDCGAEISEEPEYADN